MICNQQLLKQIQKLNHLFDKTQKATGNNIEFQSHWAKYLCVLTAGFLEKALSEVYGNFARNASSAPVARYTGRILGKVLNPKADKFVETARGFKEEWGSELKDFSDENGRKDAIDSIMSNRHLIVHGKDSSITVARLRDYFDKAVEVVEFIESQCNNKKSDGL